MARVVTDMHSAAASGATVQFEVQRIRTTRDLEQALDISVDSSYGSALFGAGVQARFRFAKSVQVQTSSLFMLVTAVIKLAFLSIDDPQLTDDAASLVDRPDIFNQRFGDTFVRGMLMGGLFVGVIQIETQNATDTESISSELSGTYGFFSADAKVKFEKVQSKYNASSFVKMYHEGGPVDLAIKDTTDPNELLQNANAFLKSFSDTPQAVSVAYQVTVAPIAIARGPLPPNEADIEHAQDVLTFCAKRRSVLLDQLNGLQYIVDNPGRFDFSNGAKIEAIQQTLADTQIDVDLIAQCAGAAINHPGEAALPVDFATAKGSIFPKAVIPSPKPVSKIGAPAPLTPAVPMVRPTPVYNFFGMLLWAGWRAREDLVKMSEQDQRNAIIVECTNLAHVPGPTLFQGYNNVALTGKAAVIIFLLQTKIRSAEQLKTMTVDDQRNVVILANHDHTGREVLKMQGYADADLVDIAIPWAFDLGLIAGQPRP